MAWWRDAVFYEIYIRSFHDSNGDGVGDLNGITARLDYLHDLGVDALWITPFYPSPQVDFGYDVSDHEAVDPQFGTLEDFDRLVQAAHARGLKVTIDLVLNHTSDQHPWFLSARGSRSSPYRDWYVWADGRSGGSEPPNNWESAFGGPAWTRDERSGQWYYHCFYQQQPDLNWRNPAVEARMLEMVHFWIARGVDGFRLDAVNTLFEDAALEDNPVLERPLVTITGVQSQHWTRTRGLPETDAVLRRLRRFTDTVAGEAVLVSEAYLASPEQLVRFYDDCDMHLPFNFFLAQVPRFEAAAFRRTIEDVERACGERWPSLVLSNHDIRRACDRYEARDSDAAARLLATLLLTLRGTPFLYYGEEIAMRTEPPASIADVRDPVGRRFWPAYKGRDGSRRPMSWARGPGAGFTSATPWLPLSADAEDRNVERQAHTRGSVLHFYRALLRLRRSSPPLRTGSLELLDTGGDVLAFARRTPTAQVAVVLNFGAEPRAVRLPVSGRVRLGTHGGEGTRLTGRATLHPFEAVVIE